MPLNFDFTDIENYEALCWGDDGKVAPITDALIWQTMVVDMGEITKENWKEFFARVDIYQRTFGTSLYDSEGGDFSLTEEHVKSHIGLSTNVRTESFERFIQKVGIRCKRDYDLPPSSMSGRLRHISTAMEKVLKDFQHGAFESESLHRASEAVGTFSANEGRTVKEILRTCSNYLDCISEELEYMEHDE